MKFNGKVAEALAEDGHNVTLLEVHYDEQPGSATHAPNVNLWKFDFDWPNRNAPIESHSSKSHQGALHQLFYDLLKPLFYLSIFFESPDIHSRLVDACKHLIENSKIVDEVRSNQFDVFIGEQLTLCGFGIGEAAGIKTKLWMSSCPMNSAMASTLGLPLTPSWVPAVFDNKNVNDQMTLSERYYNLLTELATIQGFQKAANVETQIFRVKYATRMLDLQQIAATSPLVFVNSMDFLVFPKPTTSRIVNIGGIGLDSSEEISNKLHEDIKTMLGKDSNGVVYFSMGTMAMTNFGFMENLLDIFSQVDGYHFIVRLDEKDTASREFSKRFSNIDVVSWVPQQKVLCDPNVKLFITHGGYNSLIEAGVCGVPVLVIPLFGDQTYNGKMVERNGWGRMLEKDAVIGDPTDFIKVFSEMLRSKIYHRNAQRVQQLFRSQPFSGKERLQRYIRLLEAANGSLPEYQPSSIHLDVITLYNCDLIAIIFVASLLVAITIYNIGKIVVKVVKIIVLRSFLKKKKMTE